MDTNHHPEPDLEKFIHQELRRLPNLTAPSDLAAGVLRKLEQRRALPWWRRSIWHWPATARVAALSFLGSCALLPMLAGFFFLSGWSQTLARLAADPMGSDSWVSQVIAHGTLLVNRVQGLSSNPWFLGSLLLLLSSYLLLIGAGTAFVQLGLARARNH